MSSQSAGRRRNNMRQYSAEDQALNMISKEAESRLAAKRAARAEAREIRLKEMEKQQRESEAKQDRVYELTNEHNAVKSRQLSGSRSGSRRGSTESNESESKDVDFKKKAKKVLELRELEEKYKAAMMTSAQLDNEKQSLVYQVELLKDQLEEQDEGFTELQRQYKDKCRDFDFQKRDLQSMEHELSILKQQLEIKDRLIEESGFVILSNDRGEPVLTRQTSGSSSTNGPLPSGAVLVSQETKDFLEKAGGGTLGTGITDRVTHTNIGVDNKTNVSPTNQISDPSISTIVTEGGNIVSGTLDTVDAAPKLAEVSSDLEGSESVHDGSSVVSTNVTVTNDIGVSDISVDHNPDSLSGQYLEFKRSRSSGASGADDSDEGEEFYDAVTPPSPFEKRTFEVGAESTEKVDLVEQTASEETGASTCSAEQINTPHQVEKLDMLGIAESESSSQDNNNESLATSGAMQDPVIEQDTEMGHNFDPSEDKQCEAEAVARNNELTSLDRNLTESDLNNEVGEKEMAHEPNDLAGGLTETNVNISVTLQASDEENKENNNNHGIDHSVETENHPEIKSSSELEQGDENLQTLESEFEKQNTQINKESNETEVGARDDLNEMNYSLDVECTLETEKHSEIKPTSQSKQDDESAQTVESGFKVPNTQLAKEPNMTEKEARGDLKEIDCSQNLHCSADIEKQRETKSEIESDDEKVQTMNLDSEELNAHLERESEVTEEKIPADLNVKDVSCDKNSEEICKEEKENLTEVDAEETSPTQNSSVDEKVEDESMNVPPESLAPEESVSIQESASTKESDENQNVQAIEEKRGTLFLEECNEPGLASVIEKESGQSEERAALSSKDCEDKSALKPQENPFSSDETPENEFSLDEDKINLLANEGDDNKTKIDFEREQDSEEAARETSLLSPVQHEEDEKGGKDISTENFDEPGSDKELLQLDNQNETEMNTFTHPEATVESSCLEDEMNQARVIEDEMQDERESHSTAPSDSTNVNTLVQDEHQEGTKTPEMGAESAHLHDNIEETNQNVSHEMATKVQESGSPSFNLTVDESLDKESDEGLSFSVSEHVRNTSRFSESLSEGEAATEYGFDDIDEGLDLNESESSPLEDTAEKLCSVDDDSSLKAEGDLETPIENLSHVGKEEKEESKAKSKKASTKKTSLDESKRYSFFRSKKGTPENSTPAKESKNKQSKKQAGSLSGSTLSVDTLTESTASGTASKASSYSSLEPDDLEKALDKQITEKPQKKSKKQSFFKKVFK